MIPGSYAPPNSSENWNFKQPNPASGRPAPERISCCSHSSRPWHDGWPTLGSAHALRVPRCSGSPCPSKEPLQYDPYDCKPFKHPAGFDHGTHDFPTWLEDHLVENDLPFFTVLEHGHVMPRSIARLRPQLRLCCKSVLTCIDLFPIYSS